MKLQILKRNKIKPDGNQPRKSFDVEKLVESIKERGIITPLIVTPPTNGKYTILDGERRWRASEGIKELPCIVIEKSEYEKADKRLELQLVIDEMRENYNVIDRAEAYQRYIDAGHNESDLAKLLGHAGRSQVKDVLSLLGVRRHTLDYLRKDDTNWSYHAEIETGLNGDVPEKQKARIHKRVLEGAFDTRDDLRETLQFARDHPVDREAIIDAKDKAERGMVMMKAEPIEKDYKPRQKSKLSKEDLEKMRFTDMIYSLNTINRARTLWIMSDAIEIINRYATKEQKEEIIKSIETIVKAWKKTLKEFKRS